MGKNANRCGIYIKHPCERNMRHNEVKKVLNCVEKILRMRSKRTYIEER